MSAPVSASGRPLRPADRRLLVVRHGITGHNARGVWQGHLDVPLSAEGVEQAAAVAEVIAPMRPDVVVSSDLARAAATAAAIGARCGCAVRLDARLREVHVGQWQGLSAPEVDSHFPGARAALARGEDIRRGGDGETLTEVAARASVAALTAVDVLPAGGLAVLVTHGVAARALVAEIVGIPQRAAWLGLAGLGNCCWGELREHDGQWRLFSWNHSVLQVPGGSMGEQSAY